MNAAVQDKIRTQSPMLALLTAEQYGQILKSGILPEGASIEFRDGFLIYADHEQADGNPSMPRPRIVPLTVEQYHQMIADGILEEGAPIELLGGLLVRKDRSHAGEDPMTVGHMHMWVVQQISELNESVKPHGCFICTQQPIALMPANEPEPDGALIRGSTDIFRRRKPAAEDILCLFEVADSSLSYDRTIKQQIYADAGILQYLIINLIDNVIEFRTNPRPGQGRYRHTEILRPAQKLAIPLADGSMLDVEARRLLL